MSEIVTVVLVGVGGYGTIYLKPLLDPEFRADIKLVGCVDPYAKISPLYQALQDRAIPIFDTLEAFYEELTADLAVIVTPIHLHKQQTILCMEQGSHVLCEKPVAALIDDVREIIEVRDREARALSIGYQWSHSQAIQTLKTDVLAGVFGELKRMKTMVCWPRNDAYYRRGSGWAAKKKTAAGDWILDSVASNATAHYLHNMLYVAGSAVNEAAQPIRIDVETYRANPIEMYDTCAMRVITSREVELLYLVTHAVRYEDVREPEFVFEFEQGVVTAVTEESGIRIRGYIKDGSDIDYGFPNETDTRKLEIMADVVLGKAAVICGIEAASQHTKCMNITEELISETPTFPAQMIRRDEERELNYVEGLAAALALAYDSWRLPSELKLEGFRAAKRGDMTNYEHFGPLKLS